MENIENNGNEILYIPKSDLVISVANATDILFNSIWRILYRGNRKRQDIVPFWGPNHVVFQKTFATNLVLGAVSVVSNSALDYKLDIHSVLKFMFETELISAISLSCIDYAKDRYGIELGFCVSTTRIRDGLGLMDFTISCDDYMGYYAFFEQYKAVEKYKKYSRIIRNL